eukprot:CAMPEP_0119270648 /NCGR_PEP_ID=MMETSP1329-20130426/7565_1 /TAXON_ID=114041 /ORGANISM="Genus nov. species nov., Strain RCC1024" /LENGTH=111 /DNA_ID=CAMNT_0007270673 /DNA_START=165 /DNA_END=497 /DNA_ORIENTATION=+
MRSAVLRRALMRPAARAPYTVWAGSDAWRAQLPGGRTAALTGKPLDVEYVVDEAPRNVSAEQLDRARAIADSAAADYKVELLAEVDQMIVRGALPALSAEQKALLVEWNLR